MKLPAAGALPLPELCSGQENLGGWGAAGPLATPSGVAWPCEGSAAAVVVPSAVNACLKGTPDGAAAASGLGGFVAADSGPNEAEPHEPEPNTLDAAAEGAADAKPDAPEPKKDAAAEGAAVSALVGIMIGAAKGAAGAKPVEGAAAGSAAEAEAVLQLSAVGALAAELNAHPLVPKMGAADWLP